MINLIKNELFKMFHRISTYIILIIAILFIIITNVIYRNYDSDTYTYMSYGEIDIDSVNEFINNYDSSVDSLEDYAYNLALLDCYSLTQDYAVDSWQYDIFMSKYLELDIEYYLEVHSDNRNEDKIDELNANMLAILQAVYNDNWEYFATSEKEYLEEEITATKEILEESNLSEADTIEYQKMLFVNSEKLELVNYRLEEDVAYGNDYLNQAISDIENNLYAIAEYYYNDDIDESEYESVVKDYHENKYILEEKIDTKDSNTLRSVLINFFSEYSFLILVFVIMLAGGIVSDEFSKGTIKNLLTVPHERASILWAKYITVLLSILFIVVFLLLGELLIGGILLGFDSLSIPVVVYNMTTGNMEVLNVFSYFFINFLANLPQIILLATLAFACSVIINSTAFAITLTFCGLIGSQIINSFAYAYEIKLLNYFVTTNWDFTVYLFGGQSPFGLSIGFSGMICLTYLIIMLLVTFIVFIHKDIKNV